MISCEKNDYLFVCVCILIVVCQSISSTFSLIFPPSSYPDDPPLFFEEFPEHVHWIYADPMTDDEYRTLREIKYSKFSLGIAKENAKELMSIRNAQASATCEMFPENLPGPIVAPNPERTLCYAKVKAEQKVLESLYWIAKIPYYTLDGIYQNRYSGVKETLSGYAYSKAIYYNLKNHNDW